jgi:phenylpropionate dioxygenase-like ring-hydroxylating dioxygenase large terminal subunit
MITLLPNSSEEQFIYLTLQEAKKDFDAFDDYLVIFTNVASKDALSMIGNVVTDNARYTKLSVFTNQPLSLSGRILLTETGQYSYEVYGQNSTNNLDPDDAVVVGLIERGTLTVTGETGYDIPSISIPDNVIYYQ